MYRLIGMQYLTGAEAHLNEAHYSSAVMKVEQVGYDGHCDRPDHSAKDAGEYSGGNQLGIRMHHPAQEGARNETYVKEQVEFLAVEPVSESCGE